VREGHNVSIVARRREALDRAAQILLSMAARGAAVETISSDVSRREEAEEAVQAAVARFGAPSHLITSAGNVIPGYFHDLPTEAFEQLCAVNYLGTLYTVKAAYPSMREAGAGRIGLVASGAALVGVFGYSAYAASKFAVRGFAECLRAEARRDGIRVTIAYPPDTDTPQLAEENRTRPVESKAIAGAGGLWPAAKVAERIWNGMERGRFSVSPGWQMSALACFHSVLGPILRRAFDRIADKAGRNSTL
jgi:3-dehydrosphinganine reductase